MPQSAYALRVQQPASSSALGEVTDAVTFADPGLEGIEVFVVPALENGRIPGGVKATLQTKQWQPHMWDKVSVPQDHYLVLKGVTTRMRGNKVQFSVHKQVYPTDIDPTIGEFPSLVVLLDPVSRLPLQAYTLKDAQQVFTSESRMDVYIDAPLQEGRLPDGVRPLRSVGFLTRAAFQKLIQAGASSIVLANVPTIPTTVWKRQTASFSVLNETYRTNIPYAEETPLRLLVELDLKTGRPKAIFNQQTGEAVTLASREHVPEVFQNPVFSTSGIAAAGEPIELIYPVRGFWSDARVAGSNHILIRGWPVTGGVPTANRGTYQFNIMGRYYLTNRELEPSELLLDLIVDPRYQVPIAAFEHATDELVFDVNDQIHVHLISALSNGRVPEGTPIYAAPGTPKRSLWNKVAESNRRFVMSNVPVVKVKGGQGFRLQRVEYPVALPANALPSRKMPEKLSLVVDVHDGNLEVVAMHDAETGGVIQHPADIHGLSAVTRLAGSKAGWLKTTGLEEEWEYPPVQVVNIPGLFTIGYEGMSFAGFVAALKGKHIDVLLDVREVNHSRRTEFSGQLATSLPREGIAYVHVSDLGAPKWMRDGHTPGTNDDWFMTNYHAHLKRNIDRLDAALPQLEGKRVALMCYEKGCDQCHRYAVAKEIVRRANVTGEVRDMDAPMFPVIDSSEIAALKGELKERPQSAAPTATHPYVDRLTIQTPGALGGQVHAYLDPVITGDQIVFGASAFPTMSMVNQAFWQSAGVGQAAIAAFINMPTGRAANGKRYFHFGSRHETTLDFDSTQVRLLVFADAQQRIPLAAYNLADGQRVYLDKALAGLEELEIHAYFDPILQAGLLTPANEIEKTFRGHLFGPFLKKAEAAGIQTIAFANIPLRKRAGQRAGFRFSGKRYLANRDVEDVSGGRMLLLVNVADQTPIAGYDQVTGEVVFEPEDAIRFYLDPEVVDGKLKDPGQPFKQLYKVRSFWNDPQVQSASQVALQGVEVVSNNDQPGFFIGTEFYYVDLPSEVANTGQKLLVLVDPKTQIPSVAHVLESGASVYPMERGITIYTQTTLQDGKLPPEAHAFRVLSIVKKATFRSLQGKGPIVFTNYPTHAHSRPVQVGDQKLRHLYFSLDKVRYQTTLFESDQTVFLNVQVDPETATPLAAYDAATGEQVFVASEKLPQQVYLNPVIIGGKLVQTQAPYREVSKMQGAVWRADSVAHADRVAIANVPARPRKDVVAFSLADRVYQTSLPQQAGADQLLLVVANPKTQRPLAAYEMTVGTQAYPLEGSQPFYFGVGMLDGYEGGMPEAVPAGYFPGIQYMDKAALTQSEVHGGVTLFDVSAIDEKGSAILIVKRVRYRLGIPYDAGQRLAVAIDPDKALLAAYDQATGRQLYPVLGPLQSLGDLAASDASWLNALEPDASAPGYAGDPLRPNKLPVLAPTYGARSPNVRRQGPFSPLADAMLREAGLPPTANLGLDFTGLEGVDLYFDPVIKDGFLVGQPVPDREGVTRQTFTPEFRQALAEETDRYVMVNVKAVKTKGNRASAKLFRRNYPLGRAWSEDQNLLLEVDSKTGWVLRVFDEQTGELLYDQTKSLKIYLNVRPQGFSVPAEASLYDVRGNIPASYLNTDAPFPIETFLVENVRARPGQNAETSQYSLFGLKNQTVPVPYEEGLSFLILGDGDKVVQEVIAVFPDGRRERVINALEDKLRVYFNPTIVDGRIASEVHPDRIMTRIAPAFWTDEQVLAADAVAIAGMNTAKRGSSASFTIRGENYQTTHAPDPELKLLVTLDVAAQRPIMAYSQSTGQVLFVAGDQRQAYIDPGFSNGHLSADARMIYTGMHTSKDMLDGLESQGIEQVIVGPIPLNPQKKNTLFSVMGHSYYADGLFEQGSRAWVVIEVATGLALEAFDYNSGALIYTRPHAPIYLYAGDTFLKGGQVIGSPEPFDIFFKTREATWKAMDDAGLQRAVFANVTTAKQKKLVVFSVAGTRYKTSQTFNPDSPISLTVHVDVPNRIPIAAYLSDTGDQVYGAKPVLNDIVDLAASQAVWLDTSDITNAPTSGGVLGAKNRVHLPNWKPDHSRVPGHRSIPPFTSHLNPVGYDGQQDLAGSMDVGFVGLEENDAKKPRRRMGTPIQFYINGQVEGGVLVGTPKADADALKAPAGFWKRPAVKSADQVVMVGVRTTPFRRENGTDVLHFSVGGKGYSTTLKYESEPTPVLTVVMDPSGEVPRPVAAYHKGSESVLSSRANDDLVVYVNPQIEGGQVVRSDSEIPGRSLSRWIWNRDEVKSAKLLAIAGVKPTNHKGKARIHVRKRTYLTEADYTEELRLLLIMHPKSYGVLGAWVQGDAREKVFPSSETSGIYLDAEVSDQGQVLGNILPHNYSGGITTDLLEEPWLADAEHIVITPVSTWFREKRSETPTQEAFSVLGETYLTDRTYLETMPPVTVRLDQSTGRVVQAWDSTGPLEFRTVEKGIGLYINPVIRNGKLAAAAKPHAQVSKLNFVDWTDSKVMEAGTVWFSNVETGKQGTKANFALGGKRHITTRHYAGNEHLKLLVQVDVTGRQPIVAFDMSTGDQVYDVTQMIGLYLDPMIVRGRLHEGAAFSEARHAFTKKHISAAAQLAKQQFALGPYPTTGGTGKGKHSSTTKFSYKSEPQTVRYPYNPDSPPRFLLVIDAQTQGILSIYDWDTGDAVSGDTSLDGIRSIASSPSDWLGKPGLEEQKLVFYDPKLRKGKLVGRPPVIETIKGFAVRALLERAMHAGATHIVLDNVPGLSSTSGGQFVYFNFLGTRYPTTHPASDAEGFKMRVVVHAQTGYVQQVFAADTGTQIYPGPEMRKLYLSPEHEGGVIAADAVLYRAFYETQTSALQVDAVQQAEALIFELPLVADESGIAEFAFLMKKYNLAIPLETLSQRRVVVEVDPKTLVPSKAYLLGTQQQVYPRMYWQKSSKREGLSVYADPVIIGGRLKLDQKPELVTGRLERSDWNAAFWQSAERVAIWGVPTTGGGRTTKERFTIQGQGYTTDRTYDPSQSRRLLVVLDARSQLPMQAFDVKTGAKVFDWKSRIIVYPGTSLIEGQLPSGVVPTQLSSFLKMAAFATKMRKQGVSSVVLENVPALSTNQGAELFHMNRQNYPTGRKAKAEGVVHFRVELSITEDAVEVERAFDQASGEMVYPLTEGVRVYVDPIVQAGVLVDPKMHDVVRIVHNDVWSRLPAGTRVVAFEGIHAYNKGGRLGFGLASQNYNTGLDFPEDVDNVQLLVVAEVDSRAPLEAYRLDTQERVYAQGALALPIVAALATSTGAWLGALEDPEPTLPDSSARTSAGRVTQMGLEELFADWTSHMQTSDIYVLSDAVLTSANTTTMKATFARMPQALARRTYLIGERWRGLEEQNPALQVVADPGLESAAVAILQQVPEPQSVWVVGENLVGLSPMLQRFGMQIRQLTAPTHIAEFLLQMGRALGVPEAILQSSLEFFFSQQSLDLAA